MLLVLTNVDQRCHDDNTPFSFHALLGRNVPSPLASFLDAADLLRTPRVAFPTQ